MKVEELMKRSVKTCTSKDTLDHAARIMWEGDFGCLPVVDDEGETIAMITDRDICMAAYTQGRPLHELAVSSAASQHLVILSPDDSVDTAERLMAQHRVRRLPVVDEHSRPIGILSMTDLARHAHLGKVRGALDAESVTRTLRAICAPGVRAG